MGESGQRRLGGVGSLTLRLSLPVYLQFFLGLRRGQPAVGRWLQAAKGAA